MKDFKGQLKTIEQVSVVDVSKMLSDDVQFVDVRRVAEYRSGHAVTAINLPLDKLPNEIERLDPEKPTYVICQSGYRSSLGTSMLENAGFRSLHNVVGGTAAWIAAGLDIASEETACAGPK